MTARTTARYADGRLAGRADVLVDADAAGLTIRTLADELVAHWPAGEVRRIGTADADGTLRLCQLGGDARLVVNDAGFAAYVAANFPRLAQSPYGSRIAPWKVALWAGGAVASVALLLFVIVPAFARYLVPLVPASVETRAGTWMADLIVTQTASPEAVRQHKTTCHAPAGTAALDRIVLTLTAGEHLPYPVLVTVVNSPVVNALALPGGRIIVFRGLLDLTADPNEVAGVLAHELGHVEYRHPLQAAIKSSSGGFLVGLLLGDAVGFSAVAGLGGMLLFNHYSQDMETDADSRGLALMHRAQFATAPLAGFFAKVAARQPMLDSVPSLLLTHPGNEERAARIRADTTGGGPALDAASWQALKAICA